MGKILVAVCRVGKPVALESVDATLATYQGMVGGYIQAVTLNPDGLTLVCNEDGKLRGLPPNARIRFPDGGEDIVVGDFFLCRTADGDFAGLTPDDLKRLADPAHGSFLKERA